LLAVDPTLHWANPPQGSDPAYDTSGRDTHLTFTSTPGRYVGPVPMVTHVHGSAGVGDKSDGCAEAHAHLPRNGWPPLHGCQWKPHCVILALTQSRRFVVEKVSLSSSLTCLVSAVSAGRLNCAMISASGML
jgi:hypothetical protein